MAGVGICLNFEDVALSAGNWKTVASLKAPAQIMVKGRSLKFAGEGVAGDAKPIGVRLHMITADSGTATSSTPVKTNRAHTVTVQTAGRVNFTAEPTLTSNELLFLDKFHPQGGVYNVFLPLDFVLEKATEIALQMKLPASQTVINVSGHVLAEE